MAEPSADMIYPYGDHAGSRIREMPTNYLESLVRKWRDTDGLHGRLAAAAREVVDNRRRIVAGKAA
ncbi:MAG: hypothetical protein KJ621_20630 [Proteobacteria bacterium]|nr:hypothetical protein [Pseudomonadota bacterium]MBU1739925.1 hypothetical protein [Pseudomonadota bacterium]